MVSNPTYERIPLPATPYKSFREFYPFYLGEHRDRANRLMHLVGTSTGIVIGIRTTMALVPYVAALLDQPEIVKRTSRWAIPAKDIWKWVVLSFVQGYGMAWMGHFFMERNRPATFKYPLYSLMGDFTMLWQVVTLQRKAL